LDPHPIASRHTIASFIMGDTLSQAQRHREARARMAAGDRGESAIRVARSRAVSDNARMWLLFHRNAKTRPVKNGETFVETCPDCDERAKFVEVEITENYGVFFVDLVGDKERAFRCGACGEVFDLKRDALPAAAPVAPAKSLAELEREQAIEARRRRELAEAKATRIEDELAELKKRMGR
jgi:hypothetical protein